MNLKNKNGLIVILGSCVLTLFFAALLYYVSSCIVDQLQIGMQWYRKLVLMLLRAVMTFLLLVILKKTAVLHRKPKLTIPGGVFCLLLLLYVGGEYAECSSAHPLALPKQELIAFFASFLLVGFWEELLYRGILFSTLLERLEPKYKTGKYAAVFLSGLTFSLMHLLNLFSVDSTTVISQCISTLGAGCLFGALLIWERNHIGLPMLVHGLWDIYAAVPNLFQEGHSDLGSMIHDSAPAIANSCVLSLTNIALAVGIIYARTKLDQKKKEKAVP